MTILRAFLQVLQVLEWATAEGVWLAALGGLYLWWQGGSSPILSSYSLITLGLVLWLCQHDSE
jgi:hypothetical protein